MHWQVTWVSAAAVGSIHARPLLAAGDPGSLDTALRLQVLVSPPAANHPRLRVSAPEAAQDEEDVAPGFNHARDIAQLHSCPRPVLS